MGAMVIFAQVALMFAMMCLGLFGAKKRWVSDDAVLGMTNVLVYFVTPCLILSAFHRPFDLGQLRNLGWVALIDVLYFAVFILVMRLLYMKVQDPATKRALQFGGVYSNAGFLGLPLAQALLGTDRVFFAVIFVVVFNAFVWTHGYSMFPGTPSNPVKQIVSTPAIPSVIVGLILFFTSFELPSIVMEGVNDIAAINTPLSMIVVGASLANVQWRDFLHDRWVWIGSAVRGVAIPLVIVLILWPIPLDTSIRMAILIPAACPVAAFLVLFSVMRKTSTELPSRMVCLSTIVALVTLPGSLALAQWLW